LDLSRPCANGTTLGVVVVDVKEKSSGVTSDEFQQKTVAKAEWAKITLTEEISWRQKSRVLGL